MKFLSCEKNGAGFPAVLSLDERRAIPLSELGFAQSTLERFIIESDGEALESIREKLPLSEGIPLDELVMLAAIPQPRQEIVIMENNFLLPGESAEEFELRRSKEDLLPTYYYKKAVEANRDGGTVCSYPEHVKQLDYQAEVCCVTWNDCYGVSESAAGAHIFGWTVINNVIARDLTVRHRRPYVATSLDGFLPMAPFIVTADELDGNEIALRSFVNGQLRQSDTTARVRFDARYAVADLSQASVLRAASIISLGTPFGSGADLSPQSFLTAGDVVRCEADGIGSVTSTIV